MTFTEPTMPGTQGLFQKMIDMFGTAGTIGLAIIGGAVALGLMVVLARWGWGLLKGWLSKAK
ncbi:hypothetical protein D3C74_212550 [compost metagenome]